MAYDTKHTAYSYPVTEGELLGEIEDHWLGIPVVVEVYQYDDQPIFLGNADVAGYWVVPDEIDDMTKARWLKKAQQEFA